MGIAKLFATKKLIVILFMVTVARFVIKPLFQQRTIRVLSIMPPSQTDTVIHTQTDTAIRTRSLSNYYPAIQNSNSTENNFIQHTVTEVMNVVHENKTLFKTIESKMNCWFRFVISWLSSFTQHISQTGIDNFVHLITL